MSIVAPRIEIRISLEIITGIAIFVISMSGNINYLKLRIDS